jgi:RNA 2',3'-cyclic 3'-phosphodiesterase
MSETKIRTFIAIELPEKVKHFLGEVSDKLKRFGEDIGWVKPSAMHLTLKFLGYVDAELLPRIQHEAGSVFAKQQVVEISAHGVGAFPNLFRPRVIWVGCADKENRLPPLVSRLENALEPLGFEKEKRPFSPHLTLGRVRSKVRNKGLFDAIKEREDLAGPSFVASHAILFQSILKQSGAEYVPLAEFIFHK